jgi:hypothetical protein
MRNFIASSLPPAKNPFAVKIHNNNNSNNNNNNNNNNINNNNNNNNLHSSPSIIRMTKSRRMRWTGHVARTGEKRNAQQDICRKARRKETTRQTKT